MGPTETAAAPMPPEDSSDALSGDEEEEDEEELDAESLLLSAQSGNRMQLRRHLDAGLDFDTVDEEGKTALMHAVGGGHKSCVKLLLDRGVDANIVDVGDKYSAAMYAAEGDQSECLSLLIKQARADIELRDQHGRTAFLIACETGSSSIIEQLIKSGCNMSAKDSEGKSGWQLARDESPPHDHVLAVLDGHTSEPGPLKPEKHPAVKRSAAAEQQQRPAAKRQSTPGAASAAAAGKDYAAKVAASIRRKETLADPARAPTGNALRLQAAQLAAQHRAAQVAAQVAAQAAQLAAQAGGRHGAAPKMSSSPEGPPESVCSVERMYSMNGGAAGKGAGAGAAAAAAAAAAVQTMFRQRAGANQAAQGPHTAHAGVGGKPYKPAGRMAPIPGGSEQFTPGEVVRCPHCSKETTPPGSCLQLRCPSCEHHFRPADLRAAKRRRSAESRPAQKKLKSKPSAPRCGHPTTWTILQQDCPNHLGLW